MASETLDIVRPFARLGERNYSSWNGDMMGRLMEKKCWRVVVGDLKRPDASAGDALNAYNDICDAASGLIWSGLEESMKQLVKDHLGDPRLMWETLQSYHQQKKPTNRFVAYEALLGIQKRDGESLPALAMRIQAAQRAMKDTRPEKFDLDSLDNDLACMALIRALPISEYGSFRSYSFFRRMWTSRHSWKLAPWRRRTGKPLERPLPPL